MSAQAARAPAPTARRTFAARVRDSGPALPAAALSRLLIAAAGAAGVAGTVKHDPVAAAQTLRRLGPVGNLLAGSVDRFDSGYYLAIAAHGYGPGRSGLLAFFPLYPLLIRALTPVAGSAVIAGVLISAISFGVALVLLHRLCELELSRAAADATVLLLCFAPLSFFFTAVYTESLFLALSVATVWAARSGRWRLACGLSALAALTRPTGVLLALALVVMRLRTRRSVDRALAGALLAPVALLAYLAALAAAGYSPLAPFSAQARFGRLASGPVAAVAAAVWDGLSGVARVVQGAGIYRPTIDSPLTAPAESAVLLAVLVLACAALAGVIRRLPAEYGVLAGAMLLMCLSSPAAGQPLWSFDRFTLTIFPLWMAAGAWLARRPRLLAAVLALGAVGLVFYTVQFASWSFVA